MSFRFVDEGRGIYFEIDEELTAAYLIEAADTWFESKESFKKVRYIFSDYSRARKSSLTIREIQLLAGKYEAAASVNPNVFAAYIGASDFVFGLIRMWEGYVGGIPWETQAFRSTIEARDWISEMMQLKHSFTPSFS